MNFFVKVCFGLGRLGMFMLLLLFVEVQMCVCVCVCVIIIIIYWKAAFLAEHVQVIQILIFTPKVYPVTSDNLMRGC